MLFGNDERRLLAEYSLSRSRIVDIRRQDFEFRAPSHFGGNKSRFFNHSIASGRLALEELLARQSAQVVRAAFLLLTGLVTNDGGRCVFE